jgi:hypothetical protein
VRVEIDNVQKCASKFKCQQQIVRNGEASISSVVSLAHLLTCFVFQAHIPRLGLSILKQNPTQTAVTWRHQRSCMHMAVGVGPKVYSSRPNTDTRLPTPDPHRLLLLVHNRESTPSLALCPPPAARRRRLGPCRKPAACPCRLPRRLGP